MIFYIYLVKILVLPCSSSSSFPEGHAELEVKAKTKLTNSFHHFLELTIVKSISVIFACFF